MPLATLLAMGLLASPAAATTIRFEYEDCGCDPSSGDEGTTTMIVRAGPGERNEIAVRSRPRGYLVEDRGAPLSGCRPSRRGGRFCPGDLNEVVVRLGDGDDRLEVSGHSSLGRSTTVRATTRRLSTPASSTSWPVRAATGSRPPRAPRRR